MSVGPPLFFSGFSFGSTSEQVAAVLVDVVVAGSRSIRLKAASKVLYISNDPRSALVPVRVLPATIVPARSERVAVASTPPPNAVPLAAFPAIVEFSIVHARCP